MKLNHEYGLITMTNGMLCPTCYAPIELSIRMWAIEPDHQMTPRCPNCGKKFVLKVGKGLRKEDRIG